MSTQNIRLVKYIYLDVVAYTTRTIEAQCYITQALNRIVRAVTNRYHVEESSLIYIPTGDGICIALIDTDLPHDIHIKMAREILRRIYGNNSRVIHDWKKFEVRVGINQCDDNIVTDVNGRANVAGAGINNARRVMDLADASQILVSSTVYENLHPRKTYHSSFGPELTKEVKHGLVVKMHQFVAEDIHGLNIDIPSSFTVQAKPESKLSELAAYYFAHCIQNREFIIQKRGFGQNNYALAVLIWYLAVDSLGKSEATEVAPYEPHMPDTAHNTLDEQFQLIMELPYWVCVDLYKLMRDYMIGDDKYKYFKDGWDFTVVNVEGQNKLKSEWTEIWDEFELDKVKG